MTIDYARSFFEFAENNVKVAGFLKTQELYFGSIYQLAQAFEKIIKSYYMLMKTKVEGNSQDDIYQHVIGIGHEIEDASLNLLIEIAEIEQRKFKHKADNPEGSSNAGYTRLYMLLSNRVSSYIPTLEGFKNSQLEKNFLANVQNYESFVKQKYRQYIIGARTVEINVKALKLMEYAASYNAIVNCIMNLYPCLYKMNDTARYPLNSFSYRNLWYINQNNSCDNLLIMIRTLIKKYKWILENPYVLPD